MSEFRYNPLLKSWTIVASNRQNRPMMPRGFCPFCPGSGKVPDDYDVLVYDNDFPGMSTNPPDPDKTGSSLYETKEAYGKCEVVLYSPEHRKVLYQLTLEHIRKLVDLWVTRNDKLSSDKKIQFVYIFENKGEEVGVTMPHPHGQIYAFPYIPLKIKTELDNCREYYGAHQKCLICAMNHDEAEFKKRMVYENDDFVAYIPFFTDYPYGIFIVSRIHKASISDLSDHEKNSLAQMLKILSGSFEMLFDRPFPYMMAVHQTPVNNKDYKESEQYYHFHIEFYPPLRAADRIKYNAAAETGAWAPANVLPVEETAKELRLAKLKFLSGFMNQHIRKELIREFVNLFGGKESDVFVFTAPARVNLIGEHIDYNGGMVFPAALNISMLMAIRKRKDSLVVIKDINFPGGIELSLGAPINKSVEHPWLNYPLGVLKVLTDKGYKVESGFEVLFFSEIPSGVGVSSSAAFEVVFAYGLSELFGMGISKKNIALMCQKAENDFVGVQCGIMDQFASALGEKGSAIMLNCDSLDYNYVPLALGDYLLVITNTNKERKLTDSKYNERLSECREGLKEIQKVKDVPNLCALSQDDFDQIKAQLPNATIRKRVKHAVTENIRVKQAVEALGRKDLKGFGKLMEKSHTSLRDDYEVTGFELDTLFELARKFKGCIGTRMTGAGFGGCTISLVHKDRIEEFKDAISGPYSEETGLTPTFYVCDAGDGVKRLD